MRGRLLTLAVLILTTTSAPASASARVVGTGSKASCTSTAVVAAVKAGGVIRFSCGSKPVTIVMTKTAKVVNTSSRVVIDGGGKVSLSGDGKRRILYMDTCDAAQHWTTSHCSQQATPRLTVEGLTFTRGSSTGDGATGGGAIYAFGGQLTIRNTRFVDNRCGFAQGPAVGGGAVAALWQDDAHPAFIVDSQFVGNTCDNPGAGGGGGAVFESQGNLVVTGSTFDGNRCIATGPDVGGGAIRVFMGRGDRSPVSITRSTFVDNVCSNGGALSSIAASWRIARSRFVGNRAIGVGANPAAPGTPGGGSGGAIYNDGDTMRLAITHAAMNENVANEGGGAVFFVSDDRTGNMSIVSSHLSANANMGFQTPGLPGIFFLGAQRPDIVRSVLATGSALSPRR